MGRLISSETGACVRPPRSNRMRDREGGKQRLTLERLEARIALSATAEASAIEVREPGLAFKVSSANVQIHEDINLMAAMSTKAGRPVVSGQVEFQELGPRSRVLGFAKINKKGEVSFLVHAPATPGTFVVDARYIPPPGHRSLGETSAPITINVVPLAVSSFRVQPLVRYGKIGEPLGFTVTALNALGQTVTDYTGTIDLTSPTDSASKFSKQFYIGYSLPPPIPWTLGLATFTTTTYQFKSSDQGTHTFYSTVSFGKAGAESVRAQEATNSRVRGEAVFAIA